MAPRWNQIQICGRRCRPGFMLNPLHFKSPAEEHTLSILYIGTVEINTRSHASLALRGTVQPRNEFISPITGGMTGIISQGIGALYQ